MLSNDWWPRHGCLRPWEAQRTTIGNRCGQSTARVGVLTGSIGRRPPSTLAIIVSLIFVSFLNYYFIACIL